MSNYFETIYFRDETDENDFPQKFCDHLIETIIAPHFNSDIKDKTFLDIGSGKGNHLIGFNRRGLDVSGVDLRPADKLVKKCNLEKEKLPFENNSFDIVFSKSVIEHVSNSDNFLSETLRVLKNNGIAILMTPDWESQHENFWDDYTHVKAWTRKSLQNAMKIHGFNKVDSTLIRQLPILWRFPWLKILCDLTSLLPHSFKWKDKEEQIFNSWIRFSKEKMILAIGIKND